MRRLPLYSNLRYLPITGKSSIWAPRLLPQATISGISSPFHQQVLATQRESKLWHSTGSLDSDVKTDQADDCGNDLIFDKLETPPQAVNPKRGSNFRGVYKAIICGKVRQTPAQKFLRNGKTLTIFNVATGGLFDFRNPIGDLPRPAQWHRIVVYNEILGTYAVQKLTKNSTVYVEGDIELRVCNKGDTGDVVKLPEISVRTYGKIRLIQTAEDTNNISLQEFGSTSYQS